MGRYEHINSIEQAFDVKMRKLGRFCTSTMLVCQIAKAIPLNKWYREDDHSRTQATKSQNVLNGRGK